MQEHQERLDETTNAVSRLVDKEERLRAEPAEELNRARAQVDALKETENRRALNAYYKVRYRAGLYNKLTNFKPSSGQIRKCLRVLLESLSQHKKLKNSHPEPTGECTITNNNYYRQPSGPMETHPHLTSKRLEGG